MLYGIVWSVIGAVVLSVLSEILIAEGETKKYVKGIIAVIAVAVIFSGITSLFKGGFDINSVFQNINSAETYIDERYLGEFEESLGEERKERFLSALSAEGIHGAEVFYVLDRSVDTFCFDTVYISTNNLVIDEQAENIVVKERIIELAETFFKPLSGGLNIDGKIL